MISKEDSALTVLVNGERFFLDELKDNVHELAQILRAHPEKDKQSKRRSAQFIIDAYNASPKCVSRLDVKFARSIL